MIIIDIAVIRLTCSLIVAQAIVFLPFTIRCCKSDAVKRASYFRFQIISRSPDPAIISETSTADTLSRCAYVCAEKRRYSLYYMDNTQTCHCNHGLDSNTDLHTGDDNVVYGEAENVHEELGSGCNVFVRPPARDCSQLYQNGATEDGVYTIQPEGGVTVDTWCDMANGGWTVFQRRKDGSENFFRNWNDYVTGFGDKCGEYWLGLEHIHHLTKQPSQLRVSLTTFGDVTPTYAYSYYYSFSISNSSTKYKLSVGGSSDWDCGDGFGEHSGHMFSTYDEDNDDSTTNCADSCKGGWWYADCHTSNLNGLYLNGTHASFADGMNWLYCWGQHYSLKGTVMLLK